MSKYKGIKISLSSRPIPACVCAFNDLPMLRLQDLTADDIRKYASDTLCQDKLMRKLEAVSPSSTNQFMEEITLKASGVFLWVTLVVKRLLGGLRDYDTILDLLHKLKEIPPDLEALYEKMLRETTPQYRCQGSKFFQLMLRSLETHSEYPMTLLQHSFAEKEDYPNDARSPLVPLPEQQLDWWREATEGRLRSRCCGLIEVQKSPVEDGAESFITPFHRTVVEFLRMPAIWKRIVTLTARTPFDTDQALLTSAIMEIKFASQWPHRDSPYSPALRSFLRFLAYSKHVEKHKRLASNVYLPAAKSSAVHIWHDSAFFDTPEAQDIAIHEVTSRFTRGHNLEDPEPLMLFTLSQCYASHVAPIPHFFCPASDLQSAKNPRKGSLSNGRTQSRKLLIAAYLLTLSIDEDDLAVRAVVSRNIVPCAEGRITDAIDIHYPRHYWNSRWLAKDMMAPVDNDAYSFLESYSLWEFTLNYIHHLNDRAGREFFGTKLPLHFLRLLVALLRAKPAVGKISGMDLHDALLKLVWRVWKPI